ncbi:Outer membrane receptor proteins, mostly Fe transport [Chitinophaga costaii]|uniref:Outer membrane receptor proteins, mostly Fe transport n=1 Tax=Chitinophaga costaii TaxID=1335309 RepID=A0A1C4EYZ4_9BACT|nr:TonB-dependent receptor [Chitinophaga costaii]PUZ21547.1 TonB-dependent receptor [Chitinophaga costaii]SCC48685.1 Outer membrane receptor proteins, mostly Fe transport [Chitinophaga costaii]
MHKIIILPILLCFAAPCYAQSAAGTIVDQSSHLPLGGVTVEAGEARQTVTTRDDGRFAFKHLPAGVQKITFHMAGYRTRTLPVAEVAGMADTVFLSSQATQLADVLVSANRINPYKTISENDIRMRSISNAQEVLRMVPGLFIGQHQGGGKAEQIFLRGFDNDHGTDINMSVDGMPINMVSHAHGQGYADSHFIIPETIEHTTYEKGMYNPEKGDLAVTGFVNFHTANAIPQSLVRAEAGQYNTYRVLGMVDLLGEKTKEKGQSWYAASEYRYSNSYFDNPQHFKRFNFFTKYYGRLNARNYLSATASTMYSQWKASGQIPESAVAEGIIGFYGAIDPNEGGVTARTSLNATLTTSLSDNDLLKNQLYYSHYTFDLHSNFTFFLEDTVHGDEIRQRESRDLMGYNGSYAHESHLGNSHLRSELGINLRWDGTLGSALTHTVNKFTEIRPVKLGNISELGAGAYVSETLSLTNRLTINAGLRYDHFNYRYDNKLATDSTLQGVGRYKANNQVVSPKIKVSYQLSDKAQLYWFAGRGFHSNDARAVVAANGLPTLPTAIGSDIGTVLKPTKNLLLHAAVWYSRLQQEYVYGGDGGTVEFSGPTRRLGMDFSARYQPLRALYLDVDVNYAHGRATKDPKGANYIPLAPVWSSTGGIVYNKGTGLNGSLRYRWLGDRPANENYSLKAAGYFVNDLVVNYTKRRYEVGVTVNNLFNVKWKETQFETETRLQHQQPVDGIAFTAGTKFFATAHITYFFH